MDRRPSQALALLVLALPALARDEKSLHAQWVFHSDPINCADPARSDKRWSPTAFPDSSPGCYRKRFTVTAGTRYTLEFDGPPPAEIFLNGQPLAPPFDLAIKLNQENLIAIIAPAGLSTPLRLVKDANPAAAASAVSQKPGTLRLSSPPGPFPADRTGFAVVSANRDVPLNWSVRGQGRLVGPAAFGGVNMVRSSGTAGKVTVTASTADGESASLDLWSTAVPLGNSWLREPSR